MVLKKRKIIMIVEAANIVMLVVDKVFASTVALEWSLKHAMQSQYYLFLFYFSKPYRKGNISFYILNNV